MYRTRLRSRWLTVPLAMAAALAGCSGYRSSFLNSPPPSPSPSPSSSLTALPAALPVPDSCNSPRTSLGFRYSTALTPISVLFSDPAALAVVHRELPSLVAVPRSPPRGGWPLRSFQSYAPQPAGLFDRTDAALAQLPVPPDLETRIRALPQRAMVDESAVPCYTLPHPLITSDGRGVADAATWASVRAPEIFAQFESLQFGRAPAAPAGQRFEVTEQGTPALVGKALRKRVTILLGAEPTAPKIPVVAYIPANGPRPAPILLMMGGSPAERLVNDPDLRAPGTPAPAGAVSIDKFLDAGIGMAFVNTGDYEPDSWTGYASGVRAYLATGAARTDPTQLPPDAWGALAAWGWGVSRVQDYFETDNDINARRVAITGASRWGKAALWAAARDQRFAAVITCCSGKGGAALFRRGFGDNLSANADSAQTRHWVAANFIAGGFASNPSTLPYDTHQLIALIAPRPVLLQTGEFDILADAKGEFEALVNADPVYRLLGTDGLGGETTWPPPGTLVLHTLSYYMHNGRHGMQADDWDAYLAFLRRHLTPP